MATVHISEADAAKDLSGLLAQVRAGNDVVIDTSDDHPIVVTNRSAELRLASEALRLVEQYGGSAVLDGEFANDIASIRASGRQGLTTGWD